MADPAKGAPAKPAGAPVAMPPPPTLDAKPRPQHPLYSTANSAYGSKQASEFEKIEQWHGQKGNFSKTAALRMPPNTGFTTAVDKPRVHKDITP